MLQATFERSGSTPILGLSYLQRLDTSTPASSWNATLTKRDVFTQTHYEPQHTRASAAARSAACRSPRTAPTATSGRDFGSTAPFRAWRLRVDVPFLCFRASFSHRGRDHPRILGFFDTREVRAWYPQRPELSHQHVFLLFIRKTHAKTRKKLPSMWMRDSTATRTPVGASTVNPRACALRFRSLYDRLGQVEGRAS